MSATLEKAKDQDSPVDAVNLALKNIMAGLQELIKEEALRVSEIKAETSGEIEFNPFVNYQVEQELLGFTIGALGKINHAFQLEAHFSNYIIDKMLPPSDGTAKGTDESP